MEFSNIVLSGGVPLKVRPFFFAGLYAFSKSDGSVRPIKVSMTLRRMVAKVANVWSVRKSNHLLVPLQLGAGTKGRVEAIIHAPQSLLSSANEYQAIVKIDFTNAFNSLRRDSMLEAMATHLPELLAYVYLSYNCQSILQFGSYLIPLAEGIQQ